MPVAPAGGDHVHPLDTKQLRRGLQGFKKAKQAGEVTDDAFDAIAAQADTTGVGIPVVLFTGLSWQVPKHNSKYIHSIAAPAASASGSLQTALSKVTRP